ncbi:MAG: succinate--CoA ligase [Alphaproteobacteria bacterium]|nr:succinate--CoA ligase [Alphaproteobacteria bacterium]MBM3949822.1 succinate--CoA ligase [Rhodospirillales bacterium]
MNFEEHVAKAQFAEVGIPVPEGRLATTPAEAAAAAQTLGPVAVKAQVPAGKRGKGGAIALVDSPAEAEAAGRRILGITLGTHRVERLLVEKRVAIARELYAAVLNDPASKGPLVLFSTLGGMDIEEAAARDANAVRRRPVDILAGFTAKDADAMIAGLDLGPARAKIADLLARLYGFYRTRDAEMVEINPLALTKTGDLIALDGKLTVDDGALPRQEALAKLGVVEPLSALEARGRALGLRFIELDGNIGILANGAGLTMTTMDAVRHFGGRPANFLEIGGDAYTQAKPALELVLANPGVKSLMVNFCGAFARTDVMAEGVVKAWEELRPKIPVFFSIHGTGEEEAVKLVKARLGIEPFDLMDDAVKNAVEAAR